MNSSQLLNYFDKISDAPDAISRLRRFILDLAVRGKLIEQDPKDEPVSELLKRIQVEKARLVRDGKIRTPRPVHAIDEETTLFAIPTSWIWCRLSEVGAIVGGGTPPSEDAKNFAAGGTGIAWLTPADLGKHVELHISHGARDLTPQGLRSSSATVMPKGSILFTSRAPIGYTAIAANEVSTNQGFKSVVPYVPECNLYIAIYFRAFGKWIDDKASGTTFREVSGKIVAGLPFPLPPLAEQHRIAAKVDELMKLCDRFEAAQREIEIRREDLTSASLYRLNNGSSPKVFAEDARTCLGRLAHLTVRPGQLKQIRETVFNLAVRGQLVPQDDDEEPASQLLARLATESQAYAHEQGIAPPKPEPITPELLPYPVPKGWVWTRLCSLFRVVTDGDHQPPPKAEDGIAFLTIGNITTGTLDFSNCRYVPGSYLESLAPYRKPSYGDILYTVVGATYGRPVLVDSKRPFCVQRHIAILKPTSEVDIKFLFLLLSSPLVYEQATRSTTGAAQPTIPLRPLRNFMVPLPPLAEQHRIVPKVLELMALCGRLGEQLTTIRDEKRSLLEAVLYLSLNDESEASTIATQLATRSVDTAVSAI
jgi:type I restriction enzyme S subunit